MRHVIRWRAVLFVVALPRLAGAQFETASLIGTVRDNRSQNNFGTITATYDPRIVQLGAKISF